MTADRVTPHPQGRADVAIEARLLTDGTVEFWLAIPGSFDEVAESLRFMAAQLDAGKATRIS